MSCCDGGCCAVKERLTPCGEYHKGLEGAFHCDGVCGAIGSVWGSNPYTADSSICKAARHAGVIGPKGGSFRVTHLPGADAYEGSSANGISSLGYGAYDMSVKITKL